MRSPARAAGGWPCSRGRAGSVPGLAAFLCGLVMAELLALFGRHARPAARPVAAGGHPVRRRGPGRARGVAAAAVARLGARPQAGGSPRAGSSRDPTDPGAAWRSRLRRGAGGVLLWLAEPLLGAAGGAGRAPVDAHRAHAPVAAPPGPRACWWRSAHSRRCSSGSTTCSRSRSTRSEQRLVPPAARDGPLDRASPPRLIGCIWLGLLGAVIELTYRTPRERTEAATPTGPRAVRPRQLRGPGVAGGHGVGAPPLNSRPRAGFPIATPGPPLPIGRQEGDAPGPRGSSWRSRGEVA